MAVASVSDYYKRLVGTSPVITAGSSKTPSSSGGPGVSANQSIGSPGPAATIVQPSPSNQSSQSAGQNVTAGNNYLTGYQYNPFTVSGRTEDYRDKLSDLENNRPDAFKSQYESQINTILDGILNREQFKTDDVYDSDLYKTLREQYIQNGQKAMRDTTGNASAMTGGYGSTYAAAAGQQAYDGYLSAFTDKTLDIYDRVYNQYLQEGKEMYNKLNMLNNQDSIDYGHYRDTVSDYYNDLNYYANRADSTYNQDFGEYQSNLSAQQWAEQYAYQKTQDALSQQNWQTQFEYQQGQDALSQQNWQTQFDYQKQQDALQYAIQLAMKQAALAKSGSGGSGGSTDLSSYIAKAKSMLEATDDNNEKLYDSGSVMEYLIDKEGLTDNNVKKIMSSAGGNYDLGYKSLNSQVRK